MTQNEWLKKVERIIYETVWAMGEVHDGVKCKVYAGGGEAALAILALGPPGPGEEIRSSGAETHPSDDEIEGLAERFVNALNRRAKAAEKERDERDADAGRWAARADKAYVKLEAAEAHAARWLRAYLDAAKDAAELAAQLNAAAMGANRMPQPKPEDEGE